MSYGRLRSLVFLLLVSGNLLLLSGCAPSPLSLLTGGGPNLAANVQAGAENNQGVNIKTEAPRIELGKESKVDNIDQSTTKNSNTEPWIILLLILGWLLPSPGEIVRWVTRIFKRKN